MAKTGMSYGDPSGPMTSYGAGEGRERGARRRKVLGYLKAANDLRQSYQSQWSQQHDEQEGLPGGFPDMEIVRSGREEMVLFPSYARPHVKRERPPPSPTRSEYSGQASSSGDADFWKREWDKYEDDNAVVDVDVRGWIYSPHSGPLSRRNRLLVAVARRLSGIPTPSSPSGSRSSSRHSPHKERPDGTTSRHEDEMAAKEARSIVRRGEGEADAAWRGGYSQEQHLDSNSPFSSRSVSPDFSKEPTPGQFSNSATDTSLMSGGDDASLKPISKRGSWAQPADMTKDELLVANSHMMARLKPFMSMPLINTPITVFFFNESQSQSRNVHTNESGHFTIRAALDFVPSSVRVLASENLSATEEVRITESKGISLISDIDDTIKHSAISSGAKEIFRNTFIRDLGDLTVLGVKEWYTKLSNLGVKLHYVSNSPWQLYPLLQSYFKMAGLPTGSFHLKQYSGMLQGIFEPAAERKKGSLEKIMRDFPERKFILVGDSGEADLEVYTELVATNPGRILAILIRDVTTKDTKKFFESSSRHNNSSNPESRRPSADPSPSRGDNSDSRPVLPPRRTQNTPEQKAEEDLIDFSDNPAPKADTEAKSSNADLLELERGSGTRPRKPPPVRPSKPLALRSASNDSTKLQQAQQTKKEPPPPPKPRRTNTTQTLQSSQTPQRLPFSSAQQHAQSPEDDGYVASARHKIRDAYNNLPSARGYVNGPPSAPVQSPSQPPSSNTSNPSLQRARPLAPSRNSTLSYPAAAAQYASNRLSWAGATAEYLDAGGAIQPYNKKEEIWRRRWANAQDELRGHGVMLKSWRVGADVMDETVRLVERALREMERDREGDRLSERRANGRPR